MWRYRGLRPSRAALLSAIASAQSSVQCVRRHCATEQRPRTSTPGRRGNASQTGRAGARQERPRNSAGGQHAQNERSQDNTDRSRGRGSQVIRTAPPSASVHDTTPARDWRALIGTYSTLSLLISLVSRGLYEHAGELYDQLSESSIHPRHLVYDVCNGSVVDAQDAVIHWIRAFTALGRMEKVRQVFVHALRDLCSTEEQSWGSGKTVNRSPAAYGDYVWARAESENASHDDTDSSATHAASQTRILRLDNTLLASSAAGEAALVATENGAHAVSPRPLAFPSQLRPTLFNAYLEALTKRTRYDAAEVTFVLEKMESAGCASNALTFHYLVELHLRAGLNPEGLWHELYHERRLQPLAATVQALLVRVVPYTTNGTFVLEVTQEALRCGAAVMDKKMIAEAVERWMSTPSGSSGTAHTANDAPPTSSALNGNSSSSNDSSNASSAPTFPPDCVIWLLHELELRCIHDKASFVHYIQKQHLVVLLLSCAKCADLETADKVMAVMDRHAMPHTADVLALMVWCATQAGAVERAFDLVDVMARKGYLELSDPLRRYYIECIRYTMDKHFLVLLAEALSSVPMLERALAHLLARRQAGLLTSVHALDVVVLASARLGEERRAMELVSTYVLHWHVQPRTNTFNCLLVGNSTHRGTMMHRMIYDAMRRSGVSPNGQTFRILIRQAVLSDNIDEAVAYLRDVTAQPALRVEVEMVLPILERAARAGDVDTVNRVSQFSLDCDVGIDKAVMGNVMKHLTDAGQDVAVLKGHLPLHEALRSRSKVGRQRARHTLAL